MKIIHRLRKDIQFTKGNLNIVVKDTHEDIQYVMNLLLDAMEIIQKKTNYILIRGMPLCILKIKHLGRKSFDKIVKKFSK